MSLEQGYPRSRMPEFTEEEKTFVRGAIDFFGVNHYSALLVSAAKDEEFIVPSLYGDAGVVTSVPDEWPKAASSWLIVSPIIIPTYNIFLVIVFGDDVRARFNIDTKVPKPDMLFAKCLPCDQ